MVSVPHTTGISSVESVMCMKRMRMVSFELKQGEIFFRAWLRRTTKKESQDPSEESRTARKHEHGCFNKINEPQLVTLR